MKKKVGLKKFISKVVINVSEHTAKKDVNSACVYLQYQPKQPKALKRK